MKITGLEPASFDMTNQSFNQLSYISESHKKVKPYVKL
jgi:hypothetical protein